MSKASLDNQDIAGAATIVPPASFRLESRLIAGVVALVVAGTTAAAWFRGDIAEPERLYDWQISAFYDLNAADQAVYNALLTASNELWYVHSDLLYYGSEERQANPWPSVEELDELYLMPPFTKDVAWRQQGEIEWELIASFSFEGAAVYFGSGGKLEDQSAYLLSLSHVHKGASYTNGATVWVHDDPNVAAPATVKRDSLIVNGWTEVVPYSGEMEVERLRG